jgi:hypothetical protein
MITAGVLALTVTPADAGGFGEWHTMQLGRSLVRCLCICMLYLLLFYQTDIIDVPIVMPLMRSYHNRTEGMPQTLLMATTLHMRHLRSALI